MVNLSIIIVSYNVKEYLRDCLKSLYANHPKDSFEVIIVDNDSKDDSTEMIEKEFKEVILIKNSNEGFAKANNRGVKVAKGKYVLFLNPDTVIYPHTLDGMLQFMKDHPNCGAATCRLQMVNGDIDYASHRGFPTPWNAFYLMY